MHPTGQNEVAALGKVADRQGNRRIRCSIDGADYRAGEIPAIQIENRDRESRRKALAEHGRQDSHEEER
ncbi:hypothetical protein D3C87_2203940 [compost metagenome]